jgi:hypothetical protein
MNKQYIGDGVYIQFESGLFLLTCEAPSVPNGILLDSDMIDLIARYRSSTHDRLFSAAAAATKAAIDNGPDNNDEG